jgi:hypothetical protein
MLIMFLSRKVKGYSMQRFIIHGTLVVKTMTSDMWHLFASDIAWKS